MKLVKSLHGVEIRTTSKGLRMVYIRYYANGKSYPEPVGPTEIVNGKNVTIVKARQLLKKRREEVRLARAKGEPWLSKREQAKKDRLQKAEELDARRDLKFEVWTKQFLDENAKHYSRPEEQRAKFKRLARVFAGSHADDLNTLDIRRYYEQRRDGVDKFEGSKPSVRSAQQEITALSAGYEWLRDRQAAEGRDVPNPCRGYKPRTRVNSQVYRPAHEAVVPTDEEREAVFSFDPPPPKTWRKPQAREAWAQNWRRFRVAWMLAYYAGGPRPESELCKLRRGDVVFSDDPRAKFVGMGWVTFRETKVGRRDRSVPLHPQMETALRGLLYPLPIASDEREVWESLPVFSKRGRPSEPWNRHSYRAAWEKVREALGERGCSAAW